MQDNTNVNEAGQEEIRFCPQCDYQGTDLICPICNQKMVSEDTEMDRIIQEQEKEEKADLLDSEVGLEVLAEKEVDQPEENTSNNED